MPLSAWQTAKIWLIQLVLYLASSSTANGHHLIALLCAALKRKMFGFVAKKIVSTRETE